jgi:hypothetical protein
VHSGLRPVNHELLSCRAGQTSQPESISTACMPPELLRSHLTFTDASDASRRPTIASSSSIDLQMSKRTALSAVQRLRTVLAQEHPLSALRCYPMLVCSSSTNASHSSEDAPMLASEYSRVSR